MATKKKLTAASVERINPPRDGRVEVWDAIVPGLMLRVSKSGSKSWSVVYRVAGSHRRVRRMTLGKMPIIDLSRARDAARTALEVAANGDDPANKKRLMLEGKSNARLKTFGWLVDEYEKNYAIDRRIKNWINGDNRRKLERHVLPLWNDIPVQGISRSDAKELLRQIHATKHPTIALDTLRCIRPIFAWALHEEICELNPFDKVKAPGLSSESRDRILSDSEIIAIWNAVDELGYPFGPFYKLLLLTGQRLREIAEMKWLWLDVNGEITFIEIPRSSYKTKNPHVIPLSSIAAGALLEVPRFSGEYVLSTTAGFKSISGFSKGKKRLDNIIFDQTGHRLDPWVNHDLRRTVRTNLPRLGVSADVAERVIGHVVPGVRGIYDRYTYFNEKHVALENWGRFVEKLVNGEKDNVVSFRR